MITAVVMVGEQAVGGEPAAWVQGARRAAAADLLEMLAQQPLVSRVVLVSPQLAELAARPFSDYVPSAPGAIHVGETLAGLVQQFGISHLLYMGGGAAPLLTDMALSDALRELVEAQALAITNNQFASDWLALTPAKILETWIPRLPRDNMLGWVLSAEAGHPLQALAPSAATTPWMQADSDESRTVIGS